MPSIKGTQLPCDSENGVVVTENKDHLQTVSVPKASFADLEHCLDFISKLVWELFNFHPFITVIQVTQAFLF